MTKPVIKGQFTNSNYLSFNGANENLTLLGCNANFGKKFNVSLGLGNDMNYDGNKTVNKPAIELKAKYSEGNFNAQARFRKIGGDEQYRVTFGGNYKIDNKQSIYSAVHLTTKKSDSWKTNTGAWFGYTYKFNNGISVSGELQQNIPLGHTQESLFKTLEKFNDSNKMLNLIVSIPIK